MWTLFIGILRIFQANFNKMSSSLLTSKNKFLSFGILFEFAAAFFSLIYCFTIGFYGFGPEVIICSVITGAGFVAELLTALAALKIAPLILCNLCAQGGGIIIPTVLGVILWSQPMSFIQWIGVLLFFVAVYFLSPNTETQKLTLRAGGLLFINFAINGVLGALGKYYPLQVENNNAALYSFLSYLFAGIIYCIIYFFFRDKSEKDTATPFNLEKRQYIYAVILGITCATIVYFSVVLSRTIPIVVLSIIPGVISLVGNLFTGAIFFKEKITLRNILGVLLGILCVVLIIV